MSILGNFFFVEKPETSDEVGDSEPDKAKIKFVKKFKKATERLDNIISIIDEIVDTIEITDD